METLAGAEQSEVQGAREALNELLAPVGVTETLPGTGFSPGFVNVALTAA